MADYSTTMDILQPQVGKSGDILLKFEHKNGGERGIRTLGEVAPTTIFETVAFDHSAISPLKHSHNITLKWLQGKRKSRKNGFFHSFS